MTWLRQARGIGFAVLTIGMAVTLVILGNNNGPTPGASDAVPPETPVSAPPPPAPGERSPEVSTPPSASSTRPGNSATPDPHGQHRQPSDAPIRSAATRYLRVFFDRTMPTRQWRGKLAALSTPSHAATLATVPRVEIPAVTPSHTRLLRVASSAATVLATQSDGTGLNVGLVLDENGWKVSRVIPVRRVVSQ